MSSHPHRYAPSTLALTGTGLTPPTVRPLLRAPVLGVLLACGRGTRFDPTGRTNKLMATLSNGAPIAAESARKLFQSVDEVLAVVRDPTSELALALRSEGCHTLACADADRGMGHVLATAVRHSAPEIGIIVALADMPQVQVGTIRSLRLALEQHHAIVAPYFEGRRGNPVGFGTEFLDDLRALDGDAGARGLLRDHPERLHRIDVDDPGVLIDIDTPEALAMLR